MTDKVVSGGSPANNAPAEPGRLDRASRVRRTIAWGLWDWGSAAFNAVATTFVFTVYIASSSFGHGDEPSIVLGWGLAIAGLVVFFIAPITGQQADASGRRKLWLAINTAVIVGCLAGMGMVRQSPDFLLLGVLLLAVGTVFYELAGVSYNALLNQISTPANVGRISGLGWGMGYLGGIVLLLIVYFGFINPEVGWFGVTSADGQAVRVAMVVSAIWFAIFALPVLFAVPANQAKRQVPISSPTGSVRGWRGPLLAYVELGRSIARLWRDNRGLVYFLLASAIFRDGLTGVFTFGGVLAAGTFGFSPGDVIVFAIAANVVAGISTIALGTLDDRLGPKRIIVGALVCLLIAGSAIFVLHASGAVVFWVCGLFLACFVGPAQSASRSFLARMIPAERAGEIFGLYATTGRAATFIAPAMWALCIAIGGAQYWGILGIMVVLLVGLLLVLPVRARHTQTSGAQK